MPGEVLRTSFLIPTEECAIIFDDLSSREESEVVGRKVVLRNFQYSETEVEGVPIIVKKMLLGRYLSAAIHAENYNYRANNEYLKILIDGKFEKLPVAERGVMQLGYVALRDKLEDFEDPDGYMQADVSVVPSMMEYLDFITAFRDMPLHVYLGAAIRVERWNYQNRHKRFTGAATATNNPLKPPYFYF